jgi:hypothetical protein
MNIYWRTKEIWCPYPANDCIDKRVIQYSKSKKKFDKHIFYESDNKLSMDERKLKIEELLKYKNIILIRFHKI